MFNYLDFLAVAISPDAIHLNLNSCCWHAGLGYIHTYIHTYMPTYVHAYIHTYILTYTHTYIHTYIHTYTYIYIHTYSRLEFPLKNGTTRVVAKNVFFC